MNSEIKNCIEHLESVYKEDWIKEFISDSDGNQILNTDSLSLKLDESFKSLFNKFCISLLKGEYVLDKNTISNLKEFNKLLAINFDDFLDESIQIEYLKIVKDKFIKGLKIVTNLYLSFLKLLEAHHKHPQLDIIFMSNSDLKISKPIEDRLTKNRLDFYNLIVNVYEHDHFFSDSVAFFNSLQKLKRRLDEFSSEIQFHNKYLVVLKEKLLFLIYKWQTRQRISSNQNNQSIKGYLVNNQIFFTNEVSYNHTNNTKLKEWGEYIEAHYGLNDWERKIKSKVNDINVDDLKSLSILNLHCLIKYYKDVKPNYDNLKEVVEEIKRRREKAVNTKEELYIYNRIYNYSLNNKFSLLLEKNTEEKVEYNLNDSNEINLLRNEIINFQSKSKSDNFFVEFKYTRFLIKKLNKIIENREESEGGVKEKNIVKVIDELLVTCKDNLRWSKDHYTQVFLLPFKESLVPSNIDTLPEVYYASSFILPLSVTESEKSLNFLTHKFQNIRPIALILSSLSKEFDHIKKLQEDVKTTDRKSIETITLFTAVISFIVGSISGFKFIDSLISAIFFQVIFLVSLFTLVFFVFFIVRGKKFVGNNILYLLGTYAIFIVILCGIDNSYKKEVQLKRKGVNVYIDSILKNKLFKLDKNIEYNNSLLDSIISKDVAPKTKQ